MRKRGFFAVLIGLHVLACSTNENHGEQHSNPSDSSIVEADSSALDSIGELPEGDTISYPIIAVPNTDYHGDEIPERCEHSPFLGLVFDGENHFRFVPVEVKIETVPDPIGDMEGAPASGKKLMVNSKDSLIFILENSSINSFVSSGSGQHLTGEQSDFTNHRKIRVNDQIQGEIITTVKESHDANIGFTLWKVEYTYDEGSIVLFNEKNNPEPSARLFYIGDLNGDGWMDFVYDSHLHYNIITYTLMVSEKTEAGFRLRKAAELMTSGC